MYAASRHLSDAPCELTTLEKRGSDTSFSGHTAEMEVVMEERRSFAVAVGFFVFLMDIYLAVV